MKKKVLIVIFLFGFILRIGYLSNWLEDWDSVQFALALHNFSIVDHQPHPPEYPLYILMAKAINFFVNNNTLSLTLLSAIAGAVTIIPFYILLKDGEKFRIIQEVEFVGPEEIFPRISRVNLYILQQ